MSKKPAYEELEQRIRELEEEVISRDQEDKEAKERYGALFDRSFLWVFVHDLDGNFLDANDAALSSLGYTRDEIPSHNLASILDENHQ